jgi:hypothetical protein
MDHLPLEPGFQPPDVPYIIDEACPYVYDNHGTMLGYLSRINWSYDELHDFCTGHPPADSAHTRKQAAMVMQAWLYFGLIPYITSLGVTTSDYLRIADNGETVITTRHLPQHLYEWRRLIETMDHDKRLAYIRERVDKGFGVVKYFHIVTVGFEDKLLPLLVTFAMTILVNTLALVKRDMFPDTDVIEDVSYGTYRQTLMETLGGFGWCQGDVRRLNQQFSSTTFLYLLSLGPNPSGRDHSSCEGFTCQVTQVNNAVYVPQHVNRLDNEDECDCKLVGVSEENTTASILRNIIPAVCLDNDSSIRVVNILPDADPFDHPYVAISHIWADGLGNPSANAIHLCQLRLIQKCVDTLAARHYSKLLLQQPPNHMPFWMDTLSVPAHEGHAKTLAIVSMETVYKKAIAVLVLDRDLLTMGGISRLERAVRIAASPWNTRMWTIQEGAFARILYFQFKDYAVSPEELLGNPDQWTKGDKEYDISRLLIRDALSGVLELSPLVTNNGQDKGRHLLQKICWRFSSRPSDEAICLAILLGLDVGAIADENRCAVPDRMREFIKQQKIFLSAIIFTNNKRIDERGFRWAITTYLGRTSVRPVRPSLYDPDAEYSRTAYAPWGIFENGKGLHVSYPGLWLTLTGTQWNCSTIPKGNRSAFSTKRTSDVISSRLWIPMASTLLQLPLGTPLFVKV